MRWEGGRESENLEDRRRTSQRAVAAGGGGVLLVMIIGLLMGVDPQKLLRLVGNQPGAVNVPGDVQEDDRPATPEEERGKKFAATILGYTEEVWEDLFSKSGAVYEKPRMVLFSHQVDTGCGTAPSAVGPFYCPRDRTVYLDPTFFEELSQRLGGSDAEFSQAYVIAHEIGHHVQNLLGYSEKVERVRRSESKVEANQASVRLELQADYLAGVWAHYGQQQFNFIERGDIESALKTALAIGDDRLQKNSRGFTSPESYTHGTSEQRSKWFKVGLKTGDLNRLKDLFELPYEDL